MHYASCSSGPASSRSMLPRSSTIARLLTYLVALLAIWTVTGRYWGIQHDALGYMLQAVAALDPYPLSNDIFLRYRSQDEFTVFPTIAAFAVELMGIDRAGSMLTFSFLVAWVLAAICLLRSVQDSALTWLSIGLLLVIPGWYSADEVFRYAEPFLTARTLAEALSLWALFATIASRPIMTTLLLCAALVVHPLMAFPTVLVVIAYRLPLADWQRFLMFLGLLVALALLGSYALSWREPFVAGEWLRMTRWRSGFLFVGEWSASDREVAAQTLLTLTLAALVLPSGRPRDLARSSLLVGIAGFSLAFIASEWLPLKVILQGQAWRWIWVGRFLATALLPLLLITIWMHGRAARPVAFLLSSAWLLTSAGSFSDVQPAGAGGLLCGLAICYWLVRDRLSASTLRVTTTLAWILGVVVALSFTSVFVIAFGSDFGFGRDPLWVQRTRDVLYTPGIAALIVVGVWLSCFIERRRTAAATVGIVSLVLLIGSAPGAAAAWLQTAFDSEQRAKFSEWRTLIPEESEVLWHEAPNAVWFLLDRRSYLTVSQGAGTIFSQEATAEIARRADALSALVAPGVWYLDPSTRFEEFNELTTAVLREVCRAEGLGFVVAAEDLGTHVAIAEWPGKGDFVYLYDCRLELERQVK